MSIKFDGESEMGMQISKYLDDELSPAEREVLEKHLTECGSCREVVQVFRRNEELLKSALCVEIYGNEITEKVAKQLRREEEAAPWGARILRFARRPAAGFAAAGLLAAALLAIAILQNQSISRLVDMSTEQRRRVAELEERQQLTELDFAWGEAQRRIEDAHRNFRDFAPDGAIVTVQGTTVEASLKAPAGDAAELWIVSRREAGQEAWPEPVATLPGDRFIDRGLDPGARLVYRFEAVLRSGERAVYEVPVAIEANAVNPARHDARGNDVSMTFLKYDARSRTATFSLSRTAGGRAVTESFQVRVGEPVGAEIRDRWGDLRDLATGYVLAEVSRGTQTIATTSSGLLVTRENWEAVLRPAGASAGASDPTRRVSCWKDGMVTFRVER